MWLTHMKKGNRIHSRKVNTSRFILIAFSIILQAMAVWAVIFFFSRRYIYVQLIITAIGIVLFLSIVNRSQPAVYKVPWIILFLFVPFLGLMIYATFGNVKLSRKNIKKLRHIFNEENDVYYDQQRVFSEFGEDYRGKGIATYLKNVTSLPVYSNTESVYLPTGEAFLAALTEELKSAEKFIFLEYFIVAEGQMWNQIFDVLCERAEKGVEIYFMYDDVGSMSRVKPKFYKKLREYGIKAEKFNKFYPIVSISHNNRDHRKIAVIDGKTGFISGGNIADEYINIDSPYGLWRDNAVMLKGQAVDSLIRLFVQLYNIASDIQLKEDDFINGDFSVKKDGFVFPFGDSPAPVTTEHIGESVYLNIIESAKRYLYIATPYFIVDTNITDALKRAAKRGVDVRIIIPEIPDKKIVYLMTKSFMSSLIEAGVKVYKYSGGFIHSKTALSDGEIAFVGTINMDFRSFVHHFECGVILYKTSSINDIYEDFLKLFEKKCVEFTFDEAKLKWYESLIKSLFNLFAPLM